LGVDEAAVKAGEPHADFRLMITSLIERLLSIGAARKAVWQLWYPFLTRRLRGGDVLFLNYAFESEPPVGLELDPGDEPDRACIQLYHHVVAPVDLRGKNVLEVSCGHGGGASWITRALKPASYTGLDLNPAGIRFCQTRHRVPGLTFVQGDAQRLPFPDQSFDAVVNVEASHCYPDFPGFLAEVARVLRPAGHFLCADFRSVADLPAWEAAFAAAPLEIIRSSDIRGEVLRGMDCNAGRSRALVRDHLPRVLQSPGRDFAGVPGSAVYEALKSGTLAYRSWCGRRV
jgi:SAM-dependent methyltransferase